LVDVAGLEPAAPCLPRAWYRVVYLSRISDAIYVLHWFEKKSREMPRRNFEKARQRLKAVRARKET